MNYKIIAIPKFEKELKRLVKKYPSLKKEYIELVHILKENPEHGTRINKHCFKVRIAIASKGKGKSGGARVITNFLVTDSTVYLLSIYDKSEKENLTDKELNELLQSLH